MDDGRIVSITRRDDASRAEHDHAFAGMHREIYA
jgi:hypothetical protein